MQHDEKGHFLGLSLLLMHLLLKKIYKDLSQHYWPKKHSTESFNLYHLRGKKPNNLFG